MSMLISKPAIIVLENFTKKSGSISKHLIKIKSICGSEKTPLKNEPFMIHVRVFQSYFL